MEIKYFIFINDSFYAVGGEDEKIDKRWSKSQLKVNCDETPSCFRLNGYAVTSDSICQSELYCSSIYHTPITLPLIFPVDAKLNGNVHPMTGHDDT
jgi:hypothetical protein